MADAEQICRKHVKVRQHAGNYCTWLKTRTNRLMRRAAKADPENAPVRRPIRGWSD